MQLASPPRLKRALCGMIQGMIASIRGKLIASTGAYVVLDTAGVGYKLFATQNTIIRAKAEQGEVLLHTHLIVREQVLDLYGFFDEEDVRFFELLLSVSGIGPRTALAILNLGDSATLKAAVAAGDIGFLTRISGIGKKNAQKIVLELKDKLGGSFAGNHTQADITTLDALRTLGYTESEAKEALATIPSDIEDEGERIKAALKHLSH